MKVFFLRSKLAADLTALLEELELLITRINTRKAEVASGQYFANFKGEALFNKKQSSANYLDEQLAIAYPRRIKYAAKIVSSLSAKVEEVRSVNVPGMHELALLTTDYYCLHMQTVFSGLLQECEKEAASKKLGISAAKVIKIFDDMSFIKGAYCNFAFDLYVLIDAFLREIYENFKEYNKIKNFFIKGHWQKVATLLDSSLIMISNFKAEAAIQCGESIQKIYQPAEEAKTFMAAILNTTEKSFDLSKLLSLYRNEFLINCNLYQFYTTCVDFETEQVPNVGSYYLLEGAVGVKEKTINLANLFVAAVTLFRHRSIVPFKRSNLVDIVVAMHKMGFVFFAEDCDVNKVDLNSLQAHIRHIYSMRDKFLSDIYEFYSLSLAAAKKYLAVKGDKYKKLIVNIFIYTMQFIMPVSEREQSKIKLCDKIEDQSQKSCLLKFMYLKGLVKGLAAANLKLCGQRHIPLGDLQLKLIDMMCARIVKIEQDHKFLLSIIQQAYGFNLQAITALDHAIQCDDSISWQRWEFNHLGLFGSAVPFCKAISSNLEQVNAK